MNTTQISHPHKISVNFLGCEFVFQAARSVSSLNFGQLTILDPSIPSLNILSDLVIPQQL